MTNILLSRYRLPKPCPKNVANSNAPTDYPIFMTFCRYKSEQYVKMCILNFKRFGCRKRKIWRLE